MKPDPIAPSSHWDHTRAVVTFYFFLLGVAAVGAAAYLLIYLSQVPGASEERFGKLVELPKNIGKWTKSKKLTQDGLIRERRRLLEEGSGSTRMILQVRFRDPATKKIVRIVPEKIVRRKRVKA